MISFKAKLIKFLLKKTLNYNKPLDDIRQDCEKASVKLKKKKTTTITVVDASGVKCHLIQPKGAHPQQLIMYLHGGGYCLGVFTANINSAVEYAESANKSVLLLDYRLAPEFSFPAAIEDTNRVYHWLLKTYSAENIVLTGDSSGCGLVINLLVYLRDNDHPMPACATLATPFLDASLSGNSFITKKDVDPYYVPKQAQVVNYYVNGLDVTNPYLSPLFQDVSSFPPILIHVAEDDVFRDDGIRLYEKLMGTNTQCVLTQWPGMWHIFHMHGKLLKESTYALKEFYQFYDKYIGGSNDKLQSISQ